MSESKATTQTGKRSVRMWFKRLGVAGFLFFLIKGLLWLIVPFLIGYSLW
jgi:hypothetical protein